MLEIDFSKQARNSLANLIKNSPKIGKNVFVVIKKLSSQPRQTLSP